MVEHVTDLAEIAACGVFSTPAVLIDGKRARYRKRPRLEAGLANNATWQGHTRGNAQAVRPCHTHLTPRVVLEVY